jgi:hypothetical protein
LLGDGQPAFIINKCFFLSKSNFDVTLELLFNNKKKQKKKTYFNEKGSNGTVTRLLPIETSLLVTCENEQKRYVFVKHI